ALDNSFTVSNRADFLLPIDVNAKDSTIVVTETTNPDGSPNYNFEVNIINRANISNSSITSEKIQDFSIQRRDLEDGVIVKEKLGAGTPGVNGEIFRWNGNEWDLSHESALVITEKDSIIGNE